jgi:hypothetical protein
MLKDWHNFRLTRVNPDGSMSIESDFNMSVKEAVEDATFAGKAIVNVHKVEWKGIHIGPTWSDVTDTYRNLFHEATHHE